MLHALFHHGHSLLRFPDRFINGFGGILHISGIQSGHADPSVLCHVHMGIFPDFQNLLLSQACKAEHANLIRDVLPAALRPVQLLEFRSQSFAHVNDPPGHRPQIGLPLLEQLFVVQDLARYAGTVCWRIADFAALEYGELRGYSGDSILSIRASAGHEMESTRSFTIETKVFGKRLGYAELETFSYEIANGPGVVLEIAGGKTLIRAVEKGEVFLRSYNFRDFFPLVTGGIHAGGIVSAGVKKYDAAFWCVFDGRTHAVEVEAFRLGRKVRVCFYGELYVAENLVVVGPGWGGEVDGLV